MPGLPQSPCFISLFVDGTVVSYLRTLLNRQRSPWTMLRPTLWTFPLLTSRQRNSRAGWSKKKKNPSDQFLSGVPFRKRCYPLWSHLLWRQLCCQSGVSWELTRAEWTPAGLGGGAPPHGPHSSRPRAGLLRTTLRPRTGYRSVRPANVQQTGGNHG